MKNCSTPLQIVLFIVIAIGLSACKTTNNSGASSQPKAAAQDHATNYSIEYLTVEDPMQLVQSTLDLAKNEDKLALIVLGAKWCHDSTGFATNLASENMQRIIKQHYKPVFIDVGYFEDRRDITERFGLAHYFSTPTVMIVDPNNEQLLNGDTLQKWGFADSVAITEYNTYFNSFNDPSEYIPTPISSAHEAIIEEFKRVQGERLMSAYLILRPDLKKDAEKAPGSQNNIVFFERWNEVRKFRIQLQKDIQQLYAQARLSNSLSTNNNDSTTLILPSYYTNAEFSWE